jgi:inosine-uridine nucleoside N-ribohydrolase
MCCRDVLYFTDSDKDDLYSLLLLLKEDYLGKINLVGIVCDDGFFSYPTNINVIVYFIKHVINYPKDIPVYRGICRKKNGRNFPTILQTNFLNLLKTNFNYDNTKVYFIDRNIYDLNDKSCSINILITSNMTSLSYLIYNSNYYINKITAMIGNLNVYGNILDQTATKCIIDAEYNSWLDVENFKYVLSRCFPILEIVPLDCTNYAPLNNLTLPKILNMGLFGNSELERILDKTFRLLLKTTILSEETDDIYMWDLVATLIFLGYKAEYTTEKIDLDTNGKLISGIIPTKIYKKIDLGL